MLIQALCEYYDILAKAGKVTPAGYSKAKIHYLVHLTPEGEIDNISNWQVTQGEKEKPVPREEQMPERTEKPGIEANIVEHRPLYLFGLNETDGVLSPEDKTGKAKKSHRALVESNLEFLEGLDSPVVNAYRKFLENWNPESETENPHLLGLGKSYSKSNYIFCLKGRPDLLLHLDPGLKSKWEERQSNRGTGGGEMTAQCAVTGEMAPIARIHGKIKGVAGGLATGAVLVGFNNPSECSYGMEQSYNSNISEAAMKKYTEALNYLLNSNRHKVLIDDMTVVFWAMDSGEDSELLLQEMLFGNGQDTLHAEQTERLLQNMLEGAKNGTLTERSFTTLANIDPNVDFYMVGLKPNSSRLALKFIYRRKYADILYNVARFQMDMQVSGQARAVPIYRIKRELVPPKSKDNKVNSAMMARMLEAVLCHAKYPYALFDTMVRRIKIDASDENVRFNEVRAGILKACINRNYTKKKEEEITVGLNTENQNQAYLCGRLFAVLEKLQQEALGNLNRTIKDAYFASASSTPVLVFPKLLCLAQNHLNKVKRPVYFKKLIGQVVDGIQDQFPQRLSLPEQGMFQIGYYQQYQDFFKTESTEEGEEQ